MLAPAVVAVLGDFAVVADFAVLGDVELVAAAAECAVALTAREHPTPVRPSTSRTAMMPAILRITPMTRPSLVR
jgi:hypothetical protein